VAADFFGLGIVDVSSPAAPALVGSMKTPGQAKNVAVFGTKAVVADHMSGVDFIDVSNKAKPVSLGSFFLTATRGTWSRRVRWRTLWTRLPGSTFSICRSRSVGCCDDATVSDGARQHRRLGRVRSSESKIAVLVGGGMIQVYDLSDSVKRSRRPRIKHRAAGRSAYRSTARWFT